MIKNLKIIVTTLLISILFISCGFLQPQIGQEQEVSIKKNAKSFDQEDAYVLYALRAEQIQDNKSAAELYRILFEKSQKKEYLYHSLSNNIALKENQAVIDTVDKITKGSFDDYKLIRFKVIAFLEMQKIDEAAELAGTLAKHSELKEDYILVSDIYAKQEKYDIALKYLERAYLKNYDEKVLDKMSIIMYVNLHRKKEAIAQLESHNLMHGCSALICGRLIGFYSNENNIDGILSTYLRLYETKKDIQVAEKIVQIYGYKKEYMKMIDFLEKSKTDDETLLQLYTMTKNYNKAFPLADKLYKKSGDITFLGQSAIYEYESHYKNDDKTVLNSIVQKLEKVVKEDKNPLYKNYLGYVLIDHEIDVKKGIIYIQDVLKLEPDSAYYLDSLAWGYYKLNECNRAKTIMDRVVTLEGGDDPEVINHVEKIKECIKNYKGKNKQ